MLLCCEVGAATVLAASSLRDAARVSVLRGEGSDMKAIARSLVVILVALIAVPASGGVGHDHDSRSATGHDGVDHGRHAASAVEPAG